MLLGVAFVFVYLEIRGTTTNNWARGKCICLVATCWVCFHVTWSCISLSSLFGTSCSTVVTQRNLCWPTSWSVIKWTGNVPGQSLGSQVIKLDLHHPSKEKWNKKESVGTRHGQVVGLVQFPSAPSLVLAVYTVDINNETNPIYKSWKKSNIQIMKQIKYTNHETNPIVESYHKLVIISLICFYIDALKKNRQPTRLPAAVTFARDTPAYSSYSWDLRVFLLGSVCYVFV